MPSFQDMINASVATLQSLRPLEPQLTQACDLVVAALKAGRKVLACGNGGSAADASHLVTELVVRYVQDRRPFAAVSLNESGSTLTAAGNDYSFDDVFARQVQALGQPGDVLAVFSTSGRSPNILKALKQARECGLKSVAFLGKDGGAARGQATAELIVTSQSTARVQEAHALLIHALCEMVESRLQ